MNFASLSIPSIIFALIVGDVSLVAVLLAYRGLRGQERPAVYFLGGKLCQAAGWLLISLRGAIPDPLSVSLGNAALITGFALEALALGSVKKRDAAQFAVYGGIALAGVVAAALACDATPAGRVVLATVPAASVYAALAFFMLRKERSRLRVFIACSAAGFALILAFRVAAALRDNAFSVFSPAIIQSLSFLPQIIFLVIGGAGFFFVLKERDDQLLRESEEKYRTVAENASEALVIFQDGRYVYANRAAAAILGIDDSRDLLGQDFLTFVWPDDRDRVFSAYSLLVSGEPVEEPADFRLIGPGGKPLWVSISVSVILWNGSPAVLSLLSDIDERKKQHDRIVDLLAEKELLLREVNHRVKNNLSVAVSLLTMQGSGAAGKSADDVLRDAQSRLRAMSELYEALHSKGASAELPLRLYLSSLVDEIAILFPREPPVRFTVDIDEIVLDAETLSPLGLLVNEVLTNSLKHAFDGTAAPEIVVRARDKGTSVELTCSDNGRGMGKGAGGGFGLQVIRMLSGQLEAVSSVENRGGTHWRFVFPKVRGTSKSR